MTRTRSAIRASVSSPSRQAAPRPPWKRRWSTWTPTTKATASGRSSPSSAGFRLESIRRSVRWQIPDGRYMDTNPDPQLGTFFKLFDLFAFEETRRQPTSGLARQKVARRFSQEVESQPCAITSAQPLSSFWRSMVEYPSGVSAQASGKCGRMRDGQETDQQ